MLSTITLPFSTGDYLREKYEESTVVKLNKRGRLQVKDPQYKVPTAHDLVYLDESPDWCRNSRQLQWPGEWVENYFNLHMNKTKDVGVYQKIAKEKKKLKKFNLI